MNFELTEQQLKIQSIARDFAQNELSKKILERDENKEFDMSLYEQMGELGLIGIPYPEEVGGQGGDYLSYILAVEEISKVDAAMGIAYSVAVSLYGGSVMNSAAPIEKKKEYLENVLSGKSLGSFGLTEPNAGSDAGGCVTTAIKDGDHYIINGKKHFNTNGPLTDYIAVYALTAPELGTKGFSCFIVEKGTPGFSVGKLENMMGIRSAQVSDMEFVDVKVHKDAMITAEGDGFKLAMSALDGGRIGVAAQGLGIAEGAFEIAKEYLKEREQFGKPLFKNQYLAYKMAELETEIEYCRWMLYKAAIDKQEGKRYTIPAAKAKYLCTNCAMHVTEEAVQMLGGNGYMKEYHVERMMRDAKITQIYEGTNEIQKLIISGALFR